MQSTDVNFTFGHNSANTLNSVTFKYPTTVADVGKQIGFNFLINDYGNGDVMIHFIADDFSVTKSSAIPELSAHLLIFGCLTFSSLMTRRRAISHT